MAGILFCGLLGFPCTWIPPVPVALLRGGADVYDLMVFLYSLELRVTPYSYICWDLFEVPGLG